MNDTIITIDEVEHVILCSIDFGIRRVQDTYLDPIIQLAFEIRSRATCDGCREALALLVERDLTALKDEDSEYWMEDATTTLEEWEARASDYGLIGYAEEGMYWIAAQR